MQNQKNKFVIRENSSVNLFLFVLPYVFVLLILGFGGKATAQTAIPNAPFQDGFGIDTPAGSGRHLGTPNTTIYKVTNLNDSGHGSLRYGLEEVDSPKVIVFEVSGTIELQSEITIGAFGGKEAESKGSYITIAGQTAPSPGITIKDRGIYVERNCHDILIQHLRFRPGDETVYENYHDSWSNVFGTVYSHACINPETAIDHIWYNGGTSNELTENDGAGSNIGSDEWDLDADNDFLYVDVGEDPANGELVLGFCKSCVATPLLLDTHYRVVADCVGTNDPWYGCTGEGTAVWSSNWTTPYNIVIDHNSLSWGGDMNLTSGGDSLTYSNNISSEALHHPYHTKGPHSKGSLFKADSGNAAGSKNIAYINSLLAHNDDRNPRLQGGTGIIVNNIIYDTHFGINLDDHVTRGGHVLCSIAGNYIISTDIASQQCIRLMIGTKPSSKVYIGPDNYYSGQVQTDPWNSEATTCMNHQSCFGGACNQTDVPQVNRASTAQDAIWPAGYVAMSAADARTYVLENTGARPADRDSVDARIISEIITESSTSAIIECVACVNSDCIGADDPFDCCTGAGTGNCPDRTWPTLAENHRTLEIPSNPTEIQPSGYTKLEEWLHGYLAEVEGETEDLTPPSRSNPQPTGTLSSGTTSTTISLDTDETAICKYSRIIGTNYDLMENTFANTNSANHSTTVSNLSDGNSYTYYIRCQDESNNQNTDDFEISFNIASFQTYSISNFINLVTDWLKTESGLTSDVNGDGVVNIRDLGIMMSNWQ